MFYIRVVCPELDVFIDFLVYLLSWDEAVLSFGDVYILNWALAWLCGVFTWGKFIELYT